MEGVDNKDSFCYTNSSIYTLKIRRHKLVVARTDLLH